MKILVLALSGAMALGALSVSVPAFAQPGPDRMDRHHRGHPTKVCHAEWRHHHKVRVCHNEWRR
jgi:hypothetical protein